MASLGEPGRLTEKDEKIRANVLFFQPFIVNLIDPMALLSTGTGATLTMMLGERDVADIKTVQTRCGPIQAAEVFFDCLKNSQEQGLWTAFEDTLSQEKYERVSSILEGNWIKDDIIKQNLLKLMTPIIKNNLDPVRLLDHLENKCLSREDCEQIKAEYNQRGNIAANLMLLDHLLRSKSRNFYDDFMMSLNEEKYFTLVEEIDPDYYASELYLWENEEITEAY